MRRHRTRVLSVLSGAAVRRPATTLAIAAAVGLVALTLIARLEPSAALTDMIAAESESAALLVHVLDAYPAADELIVRVRAADEAADGPARAEAAAARLRARLAAASDVARLATVVRPDRTTEAFVRDVVVRHALYYLPEDRFAEALTRFGPDAARDRVRQAETRLASPGAAVVAAADRLAEDPLGLAELATRRRPPGGDPTIVRLVGRRPATDLSFAHRLVSVVRSEIANAAEPGLRIECTGAYAIADFGARRIRRDLIVTVTGSVVLIHLLFALAFRRPLYAPLAIVPVGLGVVVGFGAHALIDTTVAPPTAAAGAILVGLGIDHAVHLLAHYGWMRRGTVPTRLLVAIQHVRRPALIALLTSLAAFLAVTMSSLPALRMFAIVAGIGLGAAFIACQTVMPAVLALAGRRAAARPRGPAPRLDPDSLVRVLVRAGRRVAVVTGLVVAAATAAVLLAPGAIFAPDQDPDLMHPQPNRPLEIQRELFARGDMHDAAILIHVRAGNWPDLLERAHEVVSRAGAADLDAAGLSVVGLPTMLPDPRTVAQRREALWRVDVEQAVAAYRAALDESVFGSSLAEAVERRIRALLRDDPPGLGDLRRHREATGRFFVRGALEGEPLETVLAVQTRRPLATRADPASVVDAVRAGPGAAPGAGVTGLTVVGLDAARVIGRDLKRLLGIAGIAIVLMLAFVLRRARDVLLVLLPLAVAVPAVLVTMRLTGDRPNAVNIVGLPLLLGIGIDDGIFLVMACERAARRGTRIARRRVLAVSCFAITLTTATTAAGFGSLAFASTPAIQSLGRLTTAGVVGAWIGTLFLLVPILISSAPGTGGRPAAGPSARQA